MPRWVTGHGWEGTGCYLCLSAPCRVPSLLSNAEQAEYDLLAAWWLAWTPPSEPYSLAAHCVVSDPARHHAYLCDQLRQGMTGQTQRAALADLRRHAKRFGGPT